MRPYLAIIKDSFRAAMASRNGSAQPVRRAGADSSTAPSPELGELTIELKYAEGEPVIREIKRVSKPGRRVYSRIKELSQVYGGLGIAILSTPKGVLSDNDARAENVGGEVLCQVF